MPQKNRSECTDVLIKNETSVRNQINMLIANAHPNVTEFIEQFQIDGKWYIVLEYCGKGDLLTYLQKNGKQSQNFCRGLAFNMINALAQMHKKGIAHRDLKLANILISDDFVFKISDFGLARVQENGYMETICGTPYAMPPEIFNQQQYNTKCDTWSLGVMLYQLLYDRIPFEAKGKSRGVHALKKAIIESEPEYIEANVDVSQKCIDFLKVCFKKNPLYRPDMCELLEHPWLKQQRINNGIDVHLSNSLNGRINKAVQEYILKLLRFHSLIVSEVQTHINTFKVFFSNKDKEKVLLLKIVRQYLQELMEMSVKLVIESEEKLIGLKKIKILSEQAKSLQKFMKSEGIPTDQDFSIEDSYQFITYLISSSQHFIDIAKSNKNLQNLIIFMFKILQKPSDSIIKINLKPQFQNPLLKQLAEQQTIEHLLSLINSSIQSQNTMWDTQYIILRDQRQGKQFELAEFVHEVLKVGLQNSDVN